MGRGRRAKVRKVVPRTLKEFEPLKQDVVQNMIAYNVDLGDQSMLLRAVTKTDLEGDLIENGQVRVLAKVKFESYSQLLILLKGIFTWPP